MCASDRFATRPFDASILQLARGPRRRSPPPRGPIPLWNEAKNTRAVTVGHGIDPPSEYALRTLALDEGRRVVARGEIVIDQALRDEPDVQVGDTLEVERFGEPITLTVVGVLARKPIGTLAAAHRFEAYVTLDDLWDITARPDRLDQIDIALRDPDKALTIGPPEGLPPDIIVQPPKTHQRARSLGELSLRPARRAVLTFICAFIILTGLTTNLLEHARIAMMRCIGVARATGPAQLVPRSRPGAGWSGKAAGAPRVHPR